MGYFDVISTLLLSTLVIVFIIGGIIISLCLIFDHFLLKYKIKLLEQKGYVKVYTSVARNRYKYSKNGCDDLSYLDIEDMSIKEIRELGE